MAASSYQQLHTVDDETATHGPQSMGAGSPGPINGARTPLFELQYQAGRHCHGSDGSELTPQINISADEDHPSREPEVAQHDTPLLNGPEVSESPVSVDPTNDESGNGFQRPALDQSAQHFPPAWMDFYFRPLFLASLSVFLILTIAVLELLHHISQHNQGLVTASESMHYAWTYGPTFVFTMIAALWGQLELRARQIMPWCLMSRGKTPAHNSLMLNYVTSSTLGSLIRSFKRKHFLVSAGICGSLVLRLIIVFASGLIQLEYRSLAFERGISVEDIFDLKKNVTYTYWEDPFPVKTSFNYWASQRYGLPLPHGTTLQFAAQTFLTGDDGEYNKLTGEVQVFESSLENCDPFKITYSADHEMYLPLSSVIPASLREKLRPWCYMRCPMDYLFEPVPVPVPVPDHRVEDFTGMGRVMYKCTNSTSIEDQDHRILFILEHWLASRKWEVSGFICEPRHSLTRRTVTNSTRYAGFEDSLNVTGAIAATLDMGVQPLDMTDKILTSLGGEEWMRGVGPDYVSSVWIAIMNYTQPQNDIWRFRNTSLFIEFSQRTWRGLAAYVMKQHYMVPSNETINGTATSTKGRLCVQELSLRLVEAQITLLLALIVTLYFIRPRVFHRNPTSLGAHAMILARSLDLSCFLQDYGVASKRVLRESLSGYLASFCQHVLPESPAIALHHSRKGSEDMAKKPTADKSDSREWWSPMSVRWWFRVCLTTATLALVIVLEVLLQVSDRKHGLGDVSLDGYLKYTWSFLPTLVLVLVGLLFSMLDSTARMLHSFQLLRRGRATMEDMFHDPARQLSLMAVVYAVWKRHFVLFWAILPGLLAPVLTIISSGLYAVAPVPWTYNAELELKDWFRPENRTVNYDGDGSNYVESDSIDTWQTFILTQLFNMSYPQWTQGEYALVSFGADNLHSHDRSDTSLSITARVPAIHTNINCSFTGHYMNDTYVTAQTPLDTHRWLPVDPRPLGCHTPPEWNRTTGQRDLYLTSNTVNNLDGTIGYDDNHDSQGYYFVLLHDEYESLVYDRHKYEIEPLRSIRICGDKRQHYFIGLGYRTEARSVLHCVPYVEALWVNAAFALPDLSLVTDVPIVPDRDSSVFLSDSASMTALPIEYWDKIVEAVVNGSSGVGQLQPGPDNNGTHRLIAALESTIAKYFAQVLNFNYRQPVGEYSNASASSAGQNLLTPDGQPATGTVTDRTRLRLIQNTVSTRILQGLLAVMGACLVASTALGRGARVIPRDPGSVASRMAYFAGGEVWRRVPVGADRWTDEQIRKHGLGVSDGRLLLGWWGGDGREVSEEGARGKRFAVDVVGCKEAA